MSAAITSFVSVCYASSIHLPGQVVVSSQSRHASTSAERLAMSYQIEALQLQAAQLATSSWSGSVRSEMSKDRRELRVEYWM